MIKKKYVFFIVLVIILVVLVQMLVQRLDLEEVSEEYQYAGVFAVSMFSCMTIVFPVPYIPVLASLAAGSAFSPFWIGVFGGVGAAVGEFTGYALGRGGLEAFPSEWREKLEPAKDFFQKYGFLAIVIVTATPLPVGIFYIVAGLAGYSIFKVLVAGIIGKVSMVLFVAYGSYYAGEFFLDLNANGGNIFPIILIGIIFVIILFFFLYKFLPRELFPF